MRYFWLIVCLTGCSAGSSETSDGVETDLDSSADTSGSDTSGSDTDLGESDQQSQVTALLPGLWEAVAYMDSGNVEEAVPPG